MVPELAAVSELVSVLKMVSVPDLVPVSVPVSASALGLVPDMVPVPVLDKKYLPPK